MRPLTVVRNLSARRRDLARMRIGNGDLVLEVGSGQNPNPRADVLCDRYLLDDTERNQNPVVVDRPLVIGDIYRLPFRSGAFDYVICAHVLEHLDEPDAAAVELGRVAKRGYIEVPSRENEILLPFPFHRWLIERDGDTLVFSTKGRPVPDPGLRAWFRQAADHIPGFSDAFLRELHALGSVHGVVWEGRPSLRVEGPPGPAESHATVPTREEELARLRETLSTSPALPWIRRMMGVLVAGPVRRRRVDLRALGRCPGCGAEDLADRGHAWSCEGCGREFPLIPSHSGSIPYLVS